MGSAPVAVVNTSPIAVSGTVTATIPNPLPVQPVKQSTARSKTKQLAASRIPILAGTDATAGIIPGVHDCECVVGNSEVTLDRFLAKSWIGFAKSASYHLRYLESCR